MPVRLAVGYETLNLRSVVRIHDGHPNKTWRIGLLGEGRRPFKAEKRVQNPYALPIYASVAVREGPGLSILEGGFESRQARQNNG